MIEVIITIITLSNSYFIGMARLVDTAGISVFVQVGSIN